VREHNDAMNRIDVIPARSEIKVDFEPGTTEIVKQHDGSFLKLAKLHPSYDPTDRSAALAHIQERQAAGEVVTGLLYVDPEPEDLHTHLKTVTTPLNRLGEAELCPGNAALAEVNAGYR
jgi:2-oxoglutarate ferredoxin oxidoreductase subunit beta